MIVQWESRSDAWRTPPAVLDLVRAVFGDIDLDPATSECANATVRARRFYTAADDALSKRWVAESVYLNPPGGKLAGKSKVRLFWQKLMIERPNYGHAIFAAFSVEALQTTQGDDPPALHPDFTICIPRRRVQWVIPGRDGSQPSHANAFIYVPSRVDASSRFVEVFSTLGLCAKGLQP